MIDIEKEICGCGGIIKYSDIKANIDEFGETDITIRYDGECNRCHKKYLWTLKCMILEETLTIETNS